MTAVGTAVQRGIQTITNITGFDSSFGVRGSCVTQAGIDQFWQSQRLAHALLCLFSSRCQMTDINTNNMTINITLKAFSCAGFGPANWTYAVLMPVAPDPPRNAVVHAAADSIKLDWLQPHDGGELNANITYLLQINTSVAGVCMRVSVCVRVFARMCDLHGHISPAEQLVLNREWSLNATFQNWSSVHP